MRFTVGPLGWVVISSTMALAFAACGKGDESRGDASDGGAAGDASTVLGGAASSAAGEGGAGNAGGEPEGAGTGNVAGQDDGAEATFPLSVEDVARIAGTSFTTPAEVAGGDCGDPVVDYLQLAFVSTGGGGIDVVASTNGPWLNIQRSRLLRSQSGYVLEPPPPTAGCWSHYFEEEELPTWTTPVRLELDFDGEDAAGKVTAMVVHAHFEAEDGPQTVTVAGVRDVRAPYIREREPYACGDGSTCYYDHSRPAWALPRRFEFTEALRPGWSVALENETGDHFEIARGDGPELVSAFEVVQFFPSGFHWVVSGYDFAGNAVQLSAGNDTYASRLPALDDGTFESEESFTRCELDPVPGPCLATSIPQHQNVPALSGTQSLYTSDQVTLRVARASGASALRFQARLVTEAQHGVASLSSRVWALDAGSSASVHQDVSSWPLDPELSTDASDISSVQDVSLPLPPGSGDVLVTLGSSSELWLDSVRTE